HHGGDDLGRWAALLAHGLSIDDGGIPLHGPRARGASRHERGLGAANCATHHLAAGMARGAWIAADPIRALDRIVRSTGAARPARGHPRVYLVDLSGDPPISEPDRACRRLCRDIAAADVARHLRAVAALEPGCAIFDRDRQGISPAPH